MSILKPETEPCYFSSPTIPFIALVLNTRHDKNNEFSLFAKPKFKKTPKESDKYEPLADLITRFIESYWSC